MHHIQYNMTAQTVYKSKDSAVQSLTYDLVVINYRSHQIFWFCLFCLFSLFSAYSACFSTYSACYSAYSACYSAYSAC